MLERALDSQLLGSSRVKRYTRIMSLVESEAAFFQRCDEIAPGLRTLLEAKNIKSFRKLAFAIGTPQTAPSEADFQGFASEVFVGAPSLSQVADLRTLHFEATAFVVAVLKEHVTGTEGPEGAQSIKRIPPAERRARLSAQQRRLRGLDLTGELCPSHALCDMANTIYETSVMTWISPSKCSKRDAEIQSVSKVEAKSAISLEKQSLVVVPHEPAKADTSTELRLQWALMRREVAFDQCRVGPAMQAALARTAQLRDVASLIWGAGVPTEPAGPIHQGREAAEPSGCHLPVGESVSSESRVSMWHLIDERPLPSEADDNIPESEDLNFLPEDSAVDEGEWYRGIRDEDHSIAPSEFSPGLDGDCLQIGRESEDPLHEVSDFSFSRLAAHSSFKRLRLERPRQAWESHPAFNRKSGSSSLHAWASAAFLPSVGVRETLNFPKPEESYGGEEAAHVPWTIERRLKGVRIQRSDEDERNHALKKLKAVVLLDPLATALGKSLVQKTGALETEEIIAASFSDAFSSKSAGTLTKRAGSLQRLVVQLYKQGVASPWRMEEADLYSALTTLREEGCGATSPAHMLESLHFLHAIARFLHLDLELAPLEQRDPLTCFQDSQKLKLLELLGTGESQILFGDALGSKTSLSKEAKTKFTPYAALAQGLTECSWARLWIEVRRQCRLTFGAGPDGFCLPTRSQRLDEWGSTPMGAGEASSYLAEILEGSELEGQVLGTHSLKVTLLTWASRSTVVRLSKGERLLLGHHIVPGVKSMVTYSREAYTSLIGKLLALYRSIRSGAFQPDLAPADRVLQVADALAAAEEGQGLGTGARDEAAAEQLAGFEGESEDSADDAEADGSLPLSAPISGGSDGGALQTGDLLVPDAEGWSKARLSKPGQISSADLLTLFDMLPQGNLQKGQRDVKQSFVTGCYSQGGFRGLRKECAEFPYASRVMTRFVQERLPGHVFSTCGIFADSLTPLHRDGRNAQWPNAVFRLSDFKEGGLWIEGPGDDVRVFNSKELVGAVHEIEDDPLIFDAWSKYHETEPWSGRRVVLITWVVQQLEKLEPQDVEAAHQLNFVLPPEVPLPVQTAQLGERPPMVFEVFAGKGLLSRALMQCGFVVHSFDQHHCDSHVPISQLDLATDSGQALFWDFLETQRPFAIHLGAPCGTSSKARGRPLYNGQPGPQPLRSSEFPLGLPSLKPGSVEATRVKLANRLYAFTYRILRYCLEHDIVVSLENPANSFLWEVLQAFEPQGVAHRILPRLQSIIFDLCCHGGFRPKRTKLLATPGCFEPLRALCDGKHMHKPWGQIVEFGSIRYATKDEAAYPALFASRFDLSLAMLGRQNKRHPLIVLKRNLAVARVKQEVKRCSDAEAELHKAMHPAVAKVMSGKSILALESLLKSEGYDDLEVIGFLKEGVRLVGTSQCPECFDRKFVPAFLTETELMASAATRRKSLLSKFERVDPEEARILKEATDEEVAMGFLEGPYYDQSQITELLGTNDWTVIRRFVLLQGAELKPRPIDNCLESQLNAGYSSSIHLRLQDSDYISAMALHVAREVSEGRAHKDASEWKGKTLDLSKAYKQLAIHPRSADNADTTASAFLDALGWRHAKTGWVFTGKVPLQLLESWKAEVGEQLICEIEMFAVLASLLQLNALVSSRRIVWWVDNDATRGVMIKGASRSWDMHTLARVFSELDREWPSMWWVCRVPSYSNPGDAPSRDQGEESLVTDPCTQASRLVLGALPRGKVLKPLVPEFGRYLKVLTYPETGALLRFMRRLPKGSKVTSRFLNGGTNACEVSHVGGYLDTVDLTSQLRQGSFDIQDVSLACFGRSLFADNAPLHKGCKAECLSERCFQKGFITKSELSMLLDVLPTDRKFAKSRGDCLDSTKTWTSGAFHFSGEAGAVRVRPADPQEQELVLEVSQHPAKLDASLVHSTDDWTGDRILLVAFHVQGATSMSCADQRRCTELGFVLDVGAAGDHIHDAAGVNCSSAETVFVGVPSDPEEFIRKAVEAGHPMDMGMHVCPAVDRAIRANFCDPPELVIQRRLSTLERWEKRASVLIGYPDVKILDEVEQGLPLTGWMAESQVFASNPRAPTMSVDTVVAMNRGFHALVKRRLSKRQDQDVEQKTWLETEEEIARGWFWIDESGCWEGKIIAHRFGLLQKLKLRTIDDCSVGGLNCTVGLPEKMRVHSIDILASMLRRALELCGGKATCGWLGRTYDLQAAYRQFGISSVARELLRIVVNKPGAEQPILLGANSLPFGAVGSVAGFLRLSMAIWTLGLVGLELCWSAYYDDFPTVTSEPLLENTSSCVDRMFRLIGLDYATEGKKAPQFASCFAALGVQVDLQQAQSGSIVIGHTDARKEELTACIDSILADGSMTSKEAEKLRGRLVFFEGFTFGRVAQVAVKHVGRHAQGSSGSVKLSADVKWALGMIKTRICHALPVTISAKALQTTYVFTDGAFEQGRGSFGGVLISPHGRCVSYFAGEVSREAMHHLLASSTHPIYELELLPVLIAMQVWGKLSSHQQTVYYLDNEPARIGMIKGAGGTAIADLIISKASALECELGQHAWYARVPSHSNIADDPSRFYFERLHKLGAARVLLDESWVASLVLEAG
ncbi:unnamed protein product [Symbiodinium sp. CCMP2592]|nr:unnamed protein product [Symbiodinium sp. CCMP2592]